MNKREFNKVIRALSVRGKVDKAKASELPREVKDALAIHIARAHGPILVEFILPEHEQWLSGCGYFYTTTGKKSGYTFRHTSEHKIV